MSSRKIASFGIAGAFAFAMVAAGRAEASSFETLPNFGVDFAPSWSPGLTDAEPIFVCSTEGGPNLDVRVFNVEDTDGPIDATFDSVPSSQNQPYDPTTVITTDADFTVAETSVPEPATLGLLGLGLLGLSRRLRGGRTAGRR
jgi:PEP-CTERM motif